MAWLHAPHPGKSLATLEQSGFADLAVVLLPGGVRRALARTSGAELAVAAYRTAGSVDVTLWLDAGDAAPASVASMEKWLEGLGYRPKERRHEGDVLFHTLESAAGPITVFSSGGRCGWSSDPERARRVTTAAESPLAAEADVMRLRDRAADADVRARLDVQRFFGMLARTRQGPQIAGQIRRLGLDRLRAIEVQGRVAGRGRFAAEVAFVLPRPWRELPAALGPPIEPVRPPQVPGRAAWMRWSVKPADLWYVAEKLYRYERAVEAALVRAQLDAVERRLQRSFTEDALGHEPRVWTVWRSREGTVLVAEVADVGLAATFLTAYAELLPAFFPDLSVSRDESAGKSVLSLSLRGRPILTLGFSKSAVVVGSDRVQVERAVEVRGRARSLGTTAVVAHGQGRGLPVALARFLPEGAGDRARAHRADWQLRTAANGLVVDATVRAGN
jgi:hypothetical protein